MNEQHPPAGQSRVLDNTVIPPMEQMAPLEAEDIPVTVRRLGRALPRQAVTLIQLGTQHSCGHWPTAVAALVTDLVDSGRPVFFVESGGMQAYGSGPVLTQICGGDPRLRVHDEQNWIVSQPPFDVSVCGDLSPTDTDGGFHHRLPTLDGIEDELGVHDETFGDSVVIIDEAHLLCPYFPAWESRSDSPSSNMTSTQVAAWRATDLLTFAQMRSTATVVVYNAEEAPEQGLQALLDVSTMHITFSRTSAHDTVEVVTSKRGALTEHWHSTSTVVPAVKLSRA